MDITFWLGTTHSISEHNLQMAGWAAESKVWELLYSKTEYNLKQAYFSESDNPNNQWSLFNWRQNAVSHH